MSRGIETAGLDEAHATYAIGAAINMIALSIWRDPNNNVATYETYEAARADATERMTFALRDLVLNWDKKEYDIMPKEYTYKVLQTRKIIFQSTEANYVPKEDVDKKVLAKTGQDPRLNKHIIDCTIRVVGEPVAEPGRGRYDRNKRMY